jgi:hypothetical protein
MFAGRGTLVFAAAALLLGQADVLAQSEPPPKAVKTFRVDRNNYPWMPTPGFRLSTEPSRPRGETIPSFAPNCDPVLQGPLPDSRTWLPWGVAHELRLKERSSKLKDSRCRRVGPRIRILAGRPERIAR